MTLASRFDAAARSLRAGAPGDALALLEGIDEGGLSDSAKSLLAHLRRRATRVDHIAVRPSVEGAQRLLELDKDAPRPGVTLVSACMNRQANLLKALPSWLASSADEIIIVDWSSSEPVAPILSQFADPRLMVVRIDAEPRWVLTHAFNVGLRLARHEVVFKLDADIVIEPDFLERNPVKPGTFVRGFWKTAVDAGQHDQRFINGSFGARKPDLRESGYYDERILTYGWDDSDLYHRLSHACGLAGHLLAHDSLHHLAQEEEQRLENQSVRKARFLEHWAPTEHENQVNKFDTILRGDWAAYLPAQDYEFSSRTPRSWTGVRATPLPQYVHGARQFAEVLAANQLVRWSPSHFPHIDFNVLNSFEFGRLLNDARAQGIDGMLVEALRKRRSVHIVRTSNPVLRDATRHTVATLRRHHASLAGAVIITEDDGFRPESAPSTEIGDLRASAQLLDALQHSLNATTHPDIAEIESVLSTSPEDCTAWTVSFDGLAQSAIRKAEQVSSRLGTHFQRSTHPADRTAVVTSIYDERNLIRAIEYLACIVLNAQSVERLVFCYEARDGTFQMIIERIWAALDAVAHRLMLVPLAKRPTFETLFGLQALLPAGTRLAVCNADIVLDGTFHKLAESSDDDVVYAISRWDIATDGYSAEPIRLENGTPNTFSADVWVATTPFEPDFHLDYAIGTIHCDSFINNQVGRSKRYRVINPCLDVHIFHLHDSRFNSSAEKQVKLKDEIERRWEAERVRNDGLTPIKGAPWSYLSHGGLTADPSFLLEWRPRALVIDMPQFTLSGLLWLHVAARLVGKVDYLTIVARLTPEDGAGAAGRLLARYKQYAGLSSLQFDIAGAPEHPEMPGAVQAESHTLDSSDLLDTLESDGVGGAAQRLDSITRISSAPNIYQIRTDLRIAGETARQTGLIRSLKTHAPYLLDDLHQFVAALDPWSEESIMLRPFETDLLETPAQSPALHLGKPDVSFVTSLYRGDDFLHGYLENVASAALECNGEVILVDANCDGHDSAAIQDFFRKYPELHKFFHVVELDSDPGLYSCWRIGIERARAPFITNANLDDRRGPLHTRRLVQLLQQRKDLAGACGSISAVTRNSTGGWFELLPNQLWFRDLGSHDFGYQDLFAYNPDGTVRSHNIMHCMPVWRRNLHSTYGYFDEERFGTSADWALWLKCAKADERFHLDVLAAGRYYLNPASHNRRHDADGAKERRIIADLIGVRQDSVVKQ